jgi:cytochrome b involved in lipid metabolism
MYKIIKLNIKGEERTFVNTQDIPIQQIEKELNQLYKECKKDNSNITYDEFLYEVDQFGLELVKENEMIMSIRLD